MAEMGVSGVASGIDWDSMITTLIERAKKPALVQVAKKEKLEGKKEYFEEFLISLRSFQSTLAPLKLSSTFKAKELTIDRLDRNTSYKGVLTATANADAEVNVHELEVVQIAKAQTYRSHSFTGNGGIGYIGGYTGATSSVTSSYFNVEAGGQTVQIEVLYTDTLQVLSDKINTALQNNEPPVTVTASVVDSRLILQNNSTGLGTTTLNTTLTRSASGNDKVEFPINPDNVDGGMYSIDMEGAGGTIKINGRYEGQDFDIVNGNEIRWRTDTTNAGYIPTGDTYQAVYTPEAGEVYTVKTTRSASDSTYDKGVLAGIQYGTATSAGTLEVSLGSTVYIEGTDYLAYGDDIMWLSGGKKPMAGLEYKVEYTAVAGNLISVDVQKNGLDDVLVSGGNPIAMTEFDGRTAVITSGGRTYTQGVDFDVVSDATGQAAINWKAYNAPDPGAGYNLELLNSDGTTRLNATGTRSNSEQIDLSGSFDRWNGTKIDNIRYIATLKEDTGSGGDYTIDAAGNLTWGAASSDLKIFLDSMASRAPGAGDEYDVEYTYNTGTFSLSDDNNGTLEHLGLLDYATEAQDAIIVVGSSTITRSSNTIGAATNNELIKGVTLELKGTGQVSIDVAHDANAAVEAINAFMTSYNDILSWINTRMTEKELDEDKKATIDSDDFRWNWGLLNGNSLLRETKNTLRQLTANTHIASVTTRSSRKSVFTPLTQAGRFTITVDGRTLTVDVEAGDTLSDIAAMINATKTPDGQNNPLRVSDSGSEYPAPYASATVSDGKLKIDSVAGSVMTLGGSSYVLAEMQLNQEYTSLSQIGLRLPSTGGGSTEESLIGQLEFDTTKFMDALENNADDVALMFNTFATQMQTYMDNTVKSSQVEVAGTTMVQGSVAREIDNITNQINAINKYLTDYERRLEEKEAALVAKFSAAEETMGKLLEQTSWLESVTNQLKSYSNG